MNYYIERPRLAIDLTYEMESDDRQGPSVDSLYETQTLKERFDIETRGWVYHPALMTYKLRLSPQWTQNLNSYGSGSSSSSDEFNLGYAVDMNFLQTKPYSLYVFARKDLTTLNTSLATSSETERDAYGATLNLKYQILPTIFSVSHTTSDQTGFYVAQESRDDARLNMRHIRPGNETEFNVTYAAQDRSTPTSFTSTENLYGTLQNRYRITEDNRISLFSNLSFRESQSNQVTSSGVSLSESLDWRHSENLNSYYSFVYSQDDTTAFIRDEILERTIVTAGLSHSLYENLSTGVSASASTSSDGQDDYGGNLNMAYQRSIPGGMIYASLAQDYRVTKRSVGGTLVRVVDEPHTLLTPVDVEVLENNNVLLNSIRVTSADRLTVYEEGRDYVITDFGTSVGISRTLLGDIDEGETVLVTYTYLSNPAYDSSTYGQSYGLGFYLWSAWRINYRYSHSQEDFISGTPPDVLADTTIHAFDTDLKWKWSTTRFLYEDSDSATGVSTTRWRLDEDLNIPLFKAAQLNMSGYVGHNNYKDLGTEENIYGFRSDLSWRVNNWSRARLEGVYEDVDGTSNKVTRMGTAVRWEWFYGIWNGDASYRFLNEEDHITLQTRDRHSLFFTVRRALF